MDSLSLLFRELLNKLPRLRVYSKKFSFFKVYSSATYGEIKYKSYHVFFYLELCTVWPKSYYIISVKTFWLTVCVSEVARRLQDCVSDSGEQEFGQQQGRKYFGGLNIEIHTGLEDICACAHPHTRKPNGDWWVELLKMQTGGQS